MKLEHVAINVPDPRAMGKWYADNLGMTIVRQQGEPPYATFISDGSGGIIEIYKNDAADVPDYGSISPFILHFAFLANDIEAVHASLVEAGATPEGEINTTPAGDKLAFLRDPWGVVVQLVQRKTPLA